MEINQGLILSSKSSAAGQVVVGTTATVLTTTDNEYGFIAPKPTNTGVIYIGTSSGVTAANGFPLTAPMPVVKRNMNQLWAIGTAAGDTVCFFTNN